MQYDSQKLFFSHWVILTIGLFLPIFMRFFNISCLSLIFNYFFLFGGISHLSVYSCSLYSIFRNFLVHSNCLLLLSIFFFLQWNSITRHLYTSEDLLHRIMTRNKLYYTGCFKSLGSYSNKPIIMLINVILLDLTTVEPL